MLSIHTQPFYSETKSERKSNSYINVTPVYGYKKVKGR